MNARKKKLKDNVGNFYVPITSPEAVVDETGKTLKTKLAELENSIGSGGSGSNTPQTRWYQKRYTSFGDSITWQHGNLTSVGEDNGKIVKGYQYWIADKLGVTLSNPALSGMTMSTKNSTNNFMTRYNTYDYTTMDLITIMLGTNDHTMDAPLGTIGNLRDTTFDTSTFYGAYRTALKHMLTANKNLRIVLLTPLYSDNWTSGGANTLGHTMLDYVNAVVKLGEMYGLPVCDLHRNSGINYHNFSNFYRDGVHPVERGYEFLGKYLANFLYNI